MKRNFLILVGTRGFASLASALAFILVGRLGGVDAIGVLGAVTSVLNFVFVVADFGLSTYASKARAKGENASVNIALKLNQISSIIFGLCAAAACAVLVWIGILSYWSLVILALALAIEKNTDTALGVPTADGKMMVVAAAHVSRRVSHLILVLALVNLGIDAVSAYCYGAMASAIMGQVLIRQWVIRNVEKVQVSFKDLKSTWLATMPFLISNVTANVRQLDTFIMTLASSTLNAGYYSAASRIVQPFYMIPSSLSTLIVPHSAKLGRTQARRVANKLSIAFLVVAVLLSSSFLYADEVVTLLLGEEFLRSALTLAILWTAMPVVALSSPLGSVLQSQGEQGYVAVNGIVFAIVAVLAIATGAFLFGSVGAAIGLGGAYAAKALSLLIQANRRLR